jgi:ribosome-associated protein
VSEPAAAALPSPLPGDALVVDDRVAIPRHELQMRASRAGGAGGQHVNKTSSRIEIRWNVRTTTALDEGARARVLEKLAARLDGDGNVRVVSSEMRSQLQNRERAERRLAELIAKALTIPKARKRTKPSRAAKENRLKEKKQRSERKKNRRSGYDE